MKLHETELRSGIWLSIMDIKPEQDVLFTFERNTPLIDFGFIAAGDMRKKLRPPSADEMEINSIPDMGGVQFAPESEGTVRISAGRRVQLVHVHMKPELFYGLIGKDLALLPDKFRAVLDGTERGSFLCCGPMEPSVISVARQILRGPSRGVPEKLYLEGKALEFVSLQISWLGGLKGHQNASPALSPGEMDKIRAVRSALIENMSSPPTLPALSKQFGISVTKLQLGFQALFGTTVFAFLKEYKMQKAKFHFEEGEMNVSEVAWELGYVNVSHFSEAYKKRFGINPKKHLESFKRNFPKDG